MKKNDSNIKKAIKYLNNNECIAIPTETVYGLAGNAYSDKAVSRVYKLKKRPRNNPLIAHYYSINSLKKDCEINNTFIKLYKKFCPGPISFVLKSITLIALISATCFLFLSVNINSFFEENGQVLASIMLFMTLGVGVFFFIKGKIGNADILFWVISQRILPPVVVVLPIYIMFQRIGLLDTHIAMILTYAVVNLPIVVWLIHDFVLTIPIDLEESAQLDGASRLYIFWDIILPLCKQGLAATTLLILILSWNEYLLASFLSTSKAQTLPIMVSAQITQDRGILWWNMCVVIIIMIIPVITMAFFLQKFITKGVLLGAVKG